MNTMNSSTTPMVDADFVDFRDFFSRLFFHRWWILICVVVTTIGALAIAFYTRPIYRVTAVLMPAKLGRGPTGVGLASGALTTLASGLGIGGPRNEEAQEALAVLRSRAFTENFILDERLLPKLYPSKWNAATNQWRVPPNERPTLSEAFTYFRKKIRSVTNDRHTGLIDLGIEWTNPKEAAQWATELIERLNKEMRARAIRRADASLVFLKDQLKHTSSVEVQNAVGYLIETQLKKRMFAQVTPDYALRFVAPPVGSDGVRPVWPRRTLLFVLGPIVGLFLGIISTILWRKSPQRNT
nr:lipopolysaccharide length regulator [uncultured proteobacterium]